ncbi:tetratricopeptide repeat protein [Pseudoponticoccus marisrubri]|uniref:Uncharacterized protein n=1 Tax=Pseudoponticoccus marisrubri TaxID=1685382 RepID=A0A0W7WLL8_9RHOB|nr:hypothetical protein [Pseudoponticoccus marisrubri]KUF11501.1 hypothetical protein AVJ23_06985 [Pseudoponticoccus marisrubri]
MRKFLFLTLLLPGAAFAAGSDTTSAPSTPKCEDGFVYDSGTDSCVQSSSSLIDEGERIEALREYAHAGDAAAARVVLSSFADQTADAVLTYRGFLARKAGDMQAAMGWYETALAANPDNLLARSYMGQGLVTVGDFVGAKRQYDEIVARGGKGSWAEIALVEAITTGTTYSY